MIMRVLVTVLGPKRSTPSLAKCQLRAISTTLGTSRVPLRRSYLYVPSSSDRMLKKSLQIDSDVLVYDLEDSVAPSQSSKSEARRQLYRFLTTTAEEHLPDPSRVAVRINDVRSPSFEDDIHEMLRVPHVRTLVLPKIRSADDLHRVSDEIRSRPADASCPSGSTMLQIIASIESAEAVWKLGEIAAWKSQHGTERGGSLTALLFAAEDYCADTAIVRTRSRLELLYTRSQIVVAAKAFGLEVIDMVCVSYKDIEYLKEECEDGRRLGFTGKQAIHPDQVHTIQSSFVPTSQEIKRAARILHQMSVAHASQKGAFGLDTSTLSGAGAGKEMIDLPMLKQAQKTVATARAAGIEVPSID